MDDILIQLDQLISGSDPTRTRVEFSPAERIRQYKRVIATSACMLSAADWERERRIELRAMRTLESMGGAADDMFDVEREWLELKVPNPMQDGSWANLYQQMRVEGGCADPATLDPAAQRGASAGVVIAVAGLMIAGGLFIYRKIT